MTGLLRLALIPFSTTRQCFIFAGVAMLVVAGVQLVYGQFTSRFVVDAWNVDSPSYLEFYAYRTALYPAFLDVLVGDDPLYPHILNRLAITQTSLYVLATGFMMGSLAIARVPIAVLVVFLIAIVSGYHLHVYHQSLLTESLGFSMVACVIGCLAQWFHTKNYWWLAGAMSAASLGFGLRANMIAFPIGVAIVGLFHLAASRRWQKTLMAVFVPFVLVMGFEGVYYHAHHQTRGTELLDRHLFGKAATVLAIHESEGQSDRFYAGEFSQFKFFMKRYGEALRTTRDSYWANGETCLWLFSYPLYEATIYWHFATPPDFGWTRQVFAAYPMTAARVIAQYYLTFFCVLNGSVAKTPILINEFLTWSSGDPPGLVKYIVLQSVHWAFILLGIGFFMAQLWYGYRWAGRGMAFFTRRWQASALTPIEALGSTAILIAIGYNLFIAIFSVPFTRFLAMSFPLIVLGILLMAATILAEYSRHATAT